MLSTRAVRGWRQMLTNQGFLATFRVAKSRVLQRFQSPRDAKGHEEQTGEQASAIPPAIHPFDLEHGVDTSGLIWGEDLASGNRNDRWSTAYYGIAPSVFNAVLAQIEDRIPGAAFVDMGSGKGRGVMLATRFPFAAIHGVELSPKLHSIAQSNLLRFCGGAAIDARIQLECKDAAEFEFPLLPLVLFFYHPFCKPVLKTVLQRLEFSLRTAPRPAHIVYINVELREVLDQTYFVTKIFEQSLNMSEADCMADRVGSTLEECAIYASTLEVGELQVVK